MNQSMKKKSPRIETESNYLVDEKYSINVDEKSSLEVTDKRHRYGKNLRMYWKKYCGIYGFGQEIPLEKSALLDAFFLWLDPMDTEAEKPEVGISFQQQITSA